MADKLNNVILAQTSATLQRDMTKEIMSHSFSRGKSAQNLQRPKTGASYGLASQANHDLQAGQPPIYNLAGEKSRFFSNLQNMHDRIGDKDDEKLPNLRPSTGLKTANRHKHQFEPCFDESDNAQHKQFNVRVNEIMQMKNTGQGLNSRVIETWINETLKDAEHLEIPGVIVKPTQKMPMNRYLIDRLYLHNAGIPIEDIDRLYRSLFVYSIGFYEMIQKAVQHAKNKYSVLSSLWKVFQILLEYCCKSNYQMMVAKISTEHSSRLEEIQQEFFAEIQQLNANEKTLKEQLEIFQTQNGELKKSLAEESSERQKLQEEICRSVKTHEEEVQLRLQFESKLNGLHSLHRDLQAKYDRSLQDIFNLETVKSIQREKLEKQNDELNDLRSRKLENEHEIQVKSEKLKSLNTENDQHKKQIQDFEIKLAAAYAEIETRNLELKEAEHKLNQAQLVQEAEKALINGLQIEKRHLESSFKENSILKEQYRQKNEELQEKFEEQFQQSEFFKRQIVGIDEIKLDRDTRIATLRGEIDTLMAKNETLVKENSVLNVQVKALDQNLQKTQEQLEEVNQNLLLANQVRQNVEEQSQELQKLYMNLQSAYQERDRLMNMFRKKFEEESKKHAETERYSNSLDVQRKALERQNELQRKQLVDRLNIQNQQIAAEKDTREIWINKYETQQKAHIASHTDFVQLKGEMQQVQLNLDNQKVISDSLVHAKTELKKQLIELQKIYTELQAKYERSRRDVMAKDELLVQIDESHKQLVLRMRKDYVNLESANVQKIEQMGLSFEDLRSQTVHLLYLHDQAVQRGNYLDEQLTQRTLEKKLLRLDLDLKIVDYNNLQDMYGKTIVELLAERQKTKNLEEEKEAQIQQLKEKKIQIEELEDTIYNQKTQISDLVLSGSNQQSQIETLVFEKSELEAMLKATNKLRVHQKVQTKAIRLTDTCIQTDFVYEPKQEATAFDQGTEQSTNMQSTQYGYGGNALIFQQVRQSDERSAEQTILRQERSAEQTILRQENINDYEMQTNKEIPITQNNGPSQSNQHIQQIQQRPQRIMSAVQPSGVQVNVHHYGQNSALSINTSDVEAPQTRTAMSVVNKYRPQEPIVEENYVQQNQDKNVQINQLFRPPSHQTNFQINQRPPSGIQIHKEQKKSVRLKHPTLADSMTWDGQQIAALNNGGPGVLLGNLLSSNPSQKDISQYNQFGQPSETMKSVYELRKTMNFGQNQVGRQHLKSAVTRPGNNNPLMNSHQFNTSGNFPVTSDHGQSSVDPSVQGPTQMQMQMQQQWLQHQQQQQQRYQVISESSSRPSVSAITGSRHQKAAGYRSHNLQPGQHQDITVKGNGSIRTLIRLANTRNDTGSPQ